MSLQYAILAVLSDSERTGYELARKMEGSVAFFWPSTHQQIYKELKELTATRLIRFRDKQQRSKPDKKIYRITPEGRTRLGQWIGEPSEPTPTRDALLIKIFAGHAAPKNSILNELSRHREVHSARLKRYLDIEKKYFRRAKLPFAALSQYLTLRRGILSERAWLAWQRECVGRWG